MKVRRTISIDSELDKEVQKILDTEIKKSIEQLKNPNSKKLRKINLEINYSTVAAALMKIGLKRKKFGWG